MKRSRLRPDPVSCQSCRSKKLKCTRVRPCSNCTSRGIPCDFLVPPPGQPAVPESSKTHAELLRRIEKLESIVLAQHDSVENRPSHDSIGGFGRPTLRGSRAETPNGLASDLNGDQDARLLENIATRDDILLHRLSKGLRFRIIGKHEIINSVSAFEDQTSSTIISLPTYNRAIQLLQNYEANVRPLCHILHMPTVRSQMKSFYLCLIQGESTPCGHAALLLSIFALSAYFYPPSDTSELATTKQEAIQLSKIMSGNALDVLDYSRRNSSGTLEDIQAYIHMAFVSYHLDGFSTRGRTLMIIAAGIARELRLHQLDAEPKDYKTDARSLIDLEIRRRVFWHITLTDWIFATTSGPQELTYMIHPNHINVNLPKDSTDEDSLPGTDNEPTSSLPTGMTFFLSRLRLGHLSREMVDTIPLSTSALMALPYSQIVTLDQKLQDLLSSLPYFYKVDSESRGLAQPLETIYSKLPTQRYVLTTEHHSRRWKLHQRFLVRQSVSLQYTYSRNACLESARAVIQGYVDLKDCEKGMGPELLGMCVHYTHLALVVMVMDLCFNRDIADEGRIKEEVKMALQLFEDGKESSGSLLFGRFLGSLKGVLGKYQVQLNEPSTTARMEKDRGVDTTEMLLDGFHNGLQEESRGGGFGINMQDDFGLDASFDDFWSAAMQGEMNAEEVAWDALFSEIDSQPA